MKIIEESLDSCLFFSVKKLDRILNKMAEEAFKPTGLAPTYGFILLILEEKKSLPQKEIAELLYVAPSTLTRFIEKLISKNLVTTKLNGRQSFVYLTDEGKELSSAVRKSWDELHRQYEHVLGEAASDALALEFNQISEQFN